MPSQQDLWRAKRLVEPVRVLLADVTQHDVGAVGGKLLGEDGHVSNGFKRAMPQPSKSFTSRVTIVFAP